MKHFLNNKKKTNYILGGLMFLVFGQALLIGKLFSERGNKEYEVNLVKINTQKDSIDFVKMKNDLTLVDQTVHDLNTFLLSKNITDEKIMALSQDSLSNTVYLAKQSNRYSQYLVDLQNKLQSVPLGLPTDGYISSNFGNRKNPIPFKPKTVALAAVKTSAKTEIKPQPQYVEEKDSLGNVIKRTPIPSTPVIPAAAKPAMAEKNNPPSEPDQIQFHKGLDIAVAYGSDVRCAAAGTVIFAGQKGGYGNCIIVSHGNGLATLYGHLSQLLVATNDHIKVNQLIAKSGNSGRSTGPHLHYEVHRNGSPVNPKLFLNF